MERWIFLSLTFGVIGIGLETIYTAFNHFWQTKDKHLRGYSSLWYLPLYALTPLFFTLLPSAFFGLLWPIKGLIYVVGIFTVEFISMGLLRMLLGSSPSEKEYYQSRHNVRGLICLDMALAWFCAGLMFEFLFSMFKLINF